MEELAKANAKITINLEGDEIFYNSVPNCFENHPFNIDISDLIGYPKSFESDESSLPLQHGQPFIATLEEVVLITLTYDINFLLCSFPPSVKLTFICPEKYKHKPSDISEEHKNRAFQVLHFPSHCTMQAKLWLLRYKTHLRVVISSANMLPIDWNAMTENFWFQDFPKAVNKKESPQIGELDWLDPHKISFFFEAELKSFVNALQVVPEAHEFLSDYDYSKAKVYLITSVPGEHYSSKLYRYGHMRMRYLLSKFEFLKELEDDPIECQTSNVGSLSPEWVYQLHQSFRGYVTYKPRAEPKLNVIFPTTRTVESSPFGKEHGWYFYYLDKGVYARPLLRDSDDPKFPGLLLHSKLYSCTKGNIGWVYCGGHNLSGSAWGKLEDDALTISNFEIGVLFVSNGKNLASPSDKLLPYQSHLRLGKIFFPFPIDAKPYQQEDTPWLPPKNKNN